MRFRLPRFSVRNVVQLAAFAPVWYLCLITAIGLTTSCSGVALAQEARPAQPTGLSATSEEHLSVSIAWDDPEDDSITGYQVLRRSRDGNTYGDGQGAREFVAIVDDTGTADTQYNDTTVTPGTRYVYRVKARNSAGLSKRSSYANAKTSGVAEAPTGLTVSSASHDSINIQWDDPQDGSITGYQVLRRSRDGDTYGDGRGAWEFVAIEDDTGAPDTEYNDGSVTTETRYVYRVKARNAAGLSERSSYANAETPAAPAAASVPAPQSDLQPAQRQESPTTRDNGGNGQNPRQRQTTSDATLSSLSANGTAVPGVNPDSTEYTLGVGNEVSRVTLEVEPRQPQATVAIRGLHYTDADDTTDGHQVDLYVGRNIIEFTVIAQDGVNTQDYTLTINRGSHVETAWTVLKDLENVLGSGSESPGGIWSDGTLIWVSGGDDLKLYAYQLSNGERESDRDIALHSDNADPKGIWSDGETMWVVDSTDRDLYAYNLESGARDSAKDFTDLGDEDADYYGIWSDGETIWVSDKIGPVVEAFNFDTGEKVPALSYTGMEPSAHDYVAGIWSDGVTMLVVGTETGREIVWEYDSPESEVSLGQGDNYRTLDGAGNHNPGAIWSDGETLWVSDTEDGKVYTYNMRVSDNADLRSVTVDGAAVPGVVPGATQFLYQVASSTSQVTLAAVPRHFKSTVFSDPLDADGASEGQQINLEVGSNTILIVVRAQDEATLVEYTLTINRASTASTEWAVLQDLEDVLGSGSDYPGGIWSDGTLIWVSGGDDLKLHAYGLATGEHDSDRDIALHSGNADPKGIWSDGTTMWVLDNDDRKLYAYNLETGARDETKDMGEFGDEDDDYYGVWSDGETLWLSNGTFAVMNTSVPALEAYDFDSGDRVSALDYVLMEPSGQHHVAGIWSDGLTMWAVDSDRNFITAYDSPESEFNQERDFRSLNAAGNTNPTDIWSDGETMWVADGEDGKIYSYNMPASNNTKLRKVVVDGMEAAGSNADGVWYATVASSSTQATVAATAAQLKATPSYGGADADAATDGHQLAIPDLAAGVTITVTAQDGDTQEHTLTVSRVNTDSAQRVLVGGSATGDITSPEEFAVVALDLVTDELYRFDLEGVDNGNGALADPRLLGLFELVYGTAVPVGNTADFLGGQGSNSSEVYHEPKPERQAKATRSTYYVVVGGAAGAAGGYRLSVSYEDEASADSSTDAAAEVLPSTKSSGKRGRYHFRGVIGEPDDIDWIKVTLEAEQMYRIVLKSATTGNLRTLTEPILIGLYTGDGTENYIWGTLATPYGHRFEARIHYYAESAGVYYISARGFADDTGSYDLLVVEMEDDCQPDNTTTHDSITVGESKDAKIDYSGDSDWFRADLVAGTTYTVEATRGEGARPLAFQRALIYDSGARMVATGERNSGANSSVATFTPELDGTYFVVVRSMLSWIGTYRVSLSQ